MKMVEKSIDVQGVRIAYTECGPEDGRLLFCVHGLLSNGRDYDVLAISLAESGYRVIAIDLPGRGKSGWFEDAALYTLPNYIPYCLALIAQVSNGQPFDWFGVSLGGMIGMLCAATAQDIKIDRLALVDIGAEVPGSALDVVSEIAKSPTQFPSLDEAVAFFRRRCSAWGIEDEAHWAHLIQHNIIRTESGFMMHFDPKIGTVLPEKNETVVLWPFWDAIKIPVLLVRGEQSKILPRDVADDMKARYTGLNFEIVTFAGCGHVPNMMQKSHIEALKRWLDVRGNGCA